MPVGCICGAVGLAFQYLILGFRARVSRLRLPLPVWMLMALGAVFTGVVGTLITMLTGIEGIWGVGDRSIKNILRDPAQFKWYNMFIFFTGRLLMSFVACALDGSGDFYSPALVCGAYLGGTISEFMVTYLGPDYNISRMYILFCMAGLFGGTTRQPFTSVLMIYDLTRFAHTSASLIFPMIVTTVTAQMFSEYFETGDLYFHMMRQDGINLERLYRSTHNIKATETGQEVLVRRISMVNKVERRVSRAPRTMEDTGVGRSRSPIEAVGLQPPVISSRKSSAVSPPPLTTAQQNHVVIDSLERSEIPAGAGEVVHDRSSQPEEPSTPMRLGAVRRKSLGHQNAAIVVKALERSEHITEEFFKDTYNSTPRSSTDIINRFS